MPQTAMRVLSVADAATVLGVAPRTVRRWLQDGLLVGKKMGTSWVVFCPAEHATVTTRPVGTGLPQHVQPTPTMIRQRLRQLGHQLMTVGNAGVGVRRARGEVFVTWRRAGRLQLTFAIGRASSTQRWAPCALGLELPFWLKERQRWRPVQRLLRQYEQLRLWCHPRLLRLPQVVEVMEEELGRLQAAIEAYAAHAGAQRMPQT
jgi:hypothetical protein